MPWDIVLIAFTGGIVGGCLSFLHQFGADGTHYLFNQKKFDRFPTLFLFQESLIGLGGVAAMLVALVWAGKFDDYSTLHQKD